MMNTSESVGHRASARKYFLITDIVPVHCCVSRRFVLCAHQPKEYYGLCSFAQPYRIFLARRYE